MKTPLLFGRTFAASCVALTLLHSANATTFDSTFVGPNNGLWNVAANWSPGMVPMNGGGDVYNVTVAQDVIARLDIDVTINNLTLGAAVGRVFGTDHNLTMTGTTSMGAGNRLDVVSSSAPAVRFNLNNLSNFSGTTLNSGGYFVTAATGTTSQLQFNNANIATNSARIGLVGAGAAIVDQNGNNALTNLTLNTDTGFIRFGSGYNFTTSNNFENQGYMVVRPGSNDTFNGSFTATETGAPDSGLIEIFATSSGPSFTQGNGESAVNGSFTNVNVAGDTLTGGLYTMASNGSATATLRFNNANIVNNAAFIDLTGPNSRILDQNGLDGLRNFASNNNAFYMARQMRSTVGSFANNGDIILFGGANLTTNGNLTSNGLLAVIPFDNYLGIGVPGFDPAPEGALTTLVTVNGNLTLGANTDLFFMIYDPTITASMRVHGLATFGGTLELLVFDPSLPNSTDSYTLILTDGQTSGAFANVPSGGRLDATYDPALNGTGDVVGSFRVVYNGNSLTITDFQPVPELVAAVSRKTHGNAGTFDIDLPLTGGPGIECRSGNGNYTLVFTFSNAVTSGNAVVTSGTATIAGNPSFSGNTMVVNLTNVANAQSVSLNLTGVSDPYGHVLADISVSGSFLLGDTNGDGVVNAGDAMQTRGRSGQPADATNFRSDVNTDGVINSGDALLVRRQSGMIIQPVANLRPDKSDGYILSGTLIPNKSNPHRRTRAVN